MEKATEFFAAILWTVVGLSHLAQPRAWVDFFIWLRGKGPTGAFVNGFLSLGFGALIVSFHNVWTGLPMILTLLGWAQVLKGLLAFVAPRVSLWSLSRISHERSREFVIAGAFALALAGVLWYIALKR